MPISAAVRSAASQSVVGQRLVGVDQPQVAEQRALAADRHAHARLEPDVRARRRAHGLRGVGDALGEVQVADDARGLARQDRGPADLVVGPEGRAVGEQAQAGVIDEHRAVELRAQLLDEGLNLVIARRHTAERASRTTMRGESAGNGSSASSRYWPMPVIQARPVISGTTAGTPADRRLLDQPAGEARADDRLVDERLAERQLAARVQLGHPRATCRCRTASGRASPGGSTWRRARRRRRGPARGRRRGGSRAMRGSSGCTGRSAALIAAMIARPARDQLVRARRVDRQARVGAPAMIA